MKEAKCTKRDEIHEAAKRLFYENGIEATSFEAIGSVCGVRPSLITYHFKTKNNLAAEIMKDIVVNVKATVAGKIMSEGLGYELKTSTVAEMFAQNRLNNYNDNTRRFLLEYMNCGMDTMFAVPKTRFYAMHDEAYRLNIDHDADELSMLSVCAFASMMGLSYTFFKGGLQCSFEQFEQYSIKQQFRFMRYPEAEIDMLYEEGKYLFEQLNIRIEPYFVIK